MNVIQTNKKKFLIARALHPKSVVYTALDMGHEVRVVMADRGDFKEWLWHESNVPGVTVVVSVLGCPQTSLYFSFEEFLSGRDRRI